MIRYLVRFENFCLIIEEGKIKSPRVPGVQGDFIYSSICVIR